jgi:hypothetical protein
MERLKLTIPEQKVGSMAGIRTMPRRRGKFALEQRRQRLKRQAEQAENDRRTK